MKHIAFRILGTFFGFALLAVAVGVLHHELRKYGFHEIAASIAAIPPTRIGLAVLFTACCYGALSCYDLLALRYLGNPLPYRRIALASFVGYAFAHNIGLSLVTGTPVKFRVYSTWGLKILDVVKVAAFCGMTFWTGFVTLAGLALLIEPARIPELMKLPATDARLVGLLLIGIVGAYLVLGFRRRSLRFGRHMLRIPSTRFGLGQIAAGSCEWIFASAVLYALFTPPLPISYPAFLGLFLFAYLSGFVSQVPGGLGVFETVILVSLEKIVPAPQIMGALIAYRVIYYIGPLLVATALLLAHEVHRKRRGR